MTQKKENGFLFPFQIRLPKDRKTIKNHFLFFVSLTDLPRVFGRFAKLGYTLPFALRREQHPTEPRTVMMLTASSFPADLIQVSIGCCFCVVVLWFVRRKLGWSNF
jgi:hypothetical protein